MSGFVELLVYVSSVGAVGCMAAKFVAIEDVRLE
jgi:hypothetical protein